MKKKWVAPCAKGERFEANEYVAACQITINSVPSSLKDGGLLYEDNGNGVWDSKDEMYMGARPTCQAGEQFTMSEEYRKPTPAWYVNGNQEPEFIYIFYGALNTTHSPHVASTYTAVNRS